MAKTDSVKAEAIVPPQQGEGKMTGWEKFQKRLFDFRGKMVTLTIMVDESGAPLCWNTPDAKRIENL